ncbi:unnamed protein product [Arabidopsis thaliana]|uniref:Uncharacterized protein n=1 Tax=Arabidopsis thaliana TaxID=3702 RepID=A0A654FMK5_ARATH|nr:unnamed protein product [Arabidopsis thaliana]
MRSLSKLSLDQFSLKSSRFSSFVPLTGTELCVDAGADEVHDGRRIIPKRHHNHRSAAAVRKEVKGRVNPNPNSTILHSLILKRFGLWSDMFEFKLNHLASFALRSNASQLFQTLLKNTPPISQTLPKNKPQRSLTLLKNTPSLLDGAFYQKLICVNRASRLSPPVGRDFLEACLRI